MVAIDATGISLSDVGAWHRRKHRSSDRHRGRFAKLHAACDEETGMFAASGVTAGNGAEAGDASQ